MENSYKSKIRGEAMSYANKISKLKSLEEQRKDLIGIIDELYNELNESGPVAENEPKKVKIANKKLPPNPPQV